MRLSSSSPPVDARQPPVAGPCPSFREIFATEARYVWRSLLALGVGESDVPDASQQVFVVLEKKLSQLNDGCALRTFIYGICLRVASDYRNRAHVRRERLCAAPPELGRAGDQETIAAHRQALERLQA